MKPRPPAPADGAAERRSSNPGSVPAGLVSIEDTIDDIAEAALEEARAREALAESKKKR